MKPSIKSDQALYAKDIACLRQTSHDEKSAAFTSVYGSIPADLRDGLLRELSLASTENDLKSTTAKLRNTVRRRAVPDYRRDWASFAYLYFGANFLKSYLAVRQYSAQLPSSPIRLLDLGCGGGASTAAALIALSKNGTVAEVIALDICKQQVALADSLLRPWIAKEFPSTTFRVERRNIFDFLEENTWSNTFAIASYVTPEISLENQNLFRRRLRDTLSDSSHALIIDSHPRTKGLLLESLNGEESAVIYDRIDMELSFLDVLGIKEKPKFAANTSALPLIRAYFEAWTHHDVDEIRKIFDRNAKYEILGLRRLEGIEEIVKYWARNARTQGNVTYDFTQWKEFSNTAIVSWQAHFDRIDLSQRRSLSGLLEVEIADGRISYLREAYHQDIEAL